MTYSPVCISFISSCLTHNISTTTTSLVPQILHHANTSLSDDQPPYLYHSIQSSSNHRAFMTTHLISSKTFPSFEQTLSTPYLKKLTHHVVPSLRTSPQLHSSLQSSLSLPPKNFNHTKLLTHPSQPASNSTHPHPIHPPRPSPQISYHDTYTCSLWFNFINDIVIGSRIYRSLEG